MLFGLLFLLRKELFGVLGGFVDLILLLFDDFIFFGDGVLANFLGLIEGFKGFIVLFIRRVQEWIQLGELVGGTSPLRNFRNYLLLFLLWRGVWVITWFSFLLFAVWPGPLHRSLWLWHITGRRCWGFLFLLFDFLHWWWWFWFLLYFRCIFVSFGKSTMLTFIDRLLFVIIFIILLLSFRWWLIFFITFIFWLILTLLLIWVFI